MPWGRIEHAISCAKVVERANRNVFLLLARLTQIFVVSGLLEHDVEFFDATQAVFGARRQPPESPVELQDTPARRSHNVAQRRRHDVSSSGHHGSNVPTDWTLETPSFPRCCGYGLPQGVAEAFSPNAVRATTSANAALQYFAIRKGDRIVCTSLICLADEVAGVYCVATIPEERGKGLGSHATAEPLRLVGKLGYGVAVLQSSRAGHSMYAKLGFADVGAVSMDVTPA